MSKPRFTPDDIQEALAGDLMGACFPDDPAVKAARAAKARREAEAKEKADAVPNSMPSRLLDAE